MPETSASFFDAPWPSDLRVNANDFVDIAGFPNPRELEILDGYLSAIESEQRGFGTNAPVYFTFSEDIDEGTLPTNPASSTQAGTSVFLINVEPDSPQVGRFHPCVLHFQSEATLFWPDHALAVRPVHGIPLEPSTTYAAVVTRGVKTRDGLDFVRSEDLEAVFAGTTNGVAAELFGGALDVIEDAGVPQDEVLNMTVFTTQDPTAGLFRIRDWMMDEYDAPVAIASSWEWKDHGDGHDVLFGAYGPSPIFQQGTLPYEGADDGGGIEFDDDGNPVLGGSFNARFAVTVPRTEQPPDGYPMVLYAHGTGGDFRSFIADETGERLAAQGFAVMGVNQIHHGDRNPTDTPPEILFFNYQNPYAARDNVRQSALDVVQQARFASTVEIPRTVLVRGSTGTVHFDPDRIYFFGHSQGGLNGPLFLGADDQTKGGVLSGSGGTLSISILEKSEPISIPGVVKLFLELPGTSAEDALERESFGFEHPVLGLLQMWAEPADPVNYARFFFADPRDGFAPKSVLMTEGVTDPYAPPAATESLASAASMPQVEPVLERIEAQELLDLALTAPPVSMNVGEGAATAGLLQFDGGHFVVFDDETAVFQARAFLRSLDDGEPTILDPEP